jgi:chromosome transmission fidelity protein 1
VVLHPKPVITAVIVRRWATSGCETKLAARKRLFFEDRGTAACDATLRAYRRHVESSPSAGALLLCVVGGKLSEGINFGDGLGRAVVILGLPYPDLRDPELRARLEHVERLHSSACGHRADEQSGSRGNLGPVAHDMYTNMCMQAVNQCIGRAIRHAQDYAAVVLVDERYTTAARGSATLVGKLPAWLTQEWRDCPTSFDAAVQALFGFYRRMDAAANESLP